ncbi:MAG: hypothetical protein JJ900_14155 [Rhodospirillales bacterium]|nr:hypothetical protein [Rhodospirillales bacterium]MBO6787986.1 hypothetical protein [Rhodospirillales bacterium]
MNPFGNMLGGWARKRHRRDVERVIEHLQTLDNESVGLVLAIAAHHRNALLKDGIDLRDLTEFVKQMPGYVGDMMKAVGVLTKNKRHHDALGLQIWVCSLRCAGDPALQERGVALWAELKRGQKHVARARELVSKETGFDLDVTMANDVPVEFQKRT